MPMGSVWTRFGEARRNNVDADGCELERERPPISLNYSQTLLVSQATQLITSGLRELKTESTCLRSNTSIQKALMRA
jgi:hypothetical protein